MDIVVVGEHSLFTIMESGKVRMQKRLDYDPSCAICYSPGEQGSNQNLIIGSFQNSLMIYSDTRLVWASRTQEAPVAVRVCTFGSLKGLLVTLTDECKIVVSYLGTDPPMQSKSPCHQHPADPCLLPISPSFSYLCK